MDKTIQIKHAECVMLLRGVDERSCQGCESAPFCINLHPDLEVLLRTVFYTKAGTKRKRIRDSPELKQLIHKYPDAVKVLE